MMNEVIPNDPLAISVTSVKGDDPILTKLESGIKKTNDDYSANLQIRTRQGDTQSPSVQPKQAAQKANKQYDWE
jgi:hypothetical protein